MEIEYGPFQRRITLAEDVDPSGGEATLRPRAAHGRAAARPEAACGQRDDRARPEEGDAERARRPRSTVDEKDIEIPPALPVLPLKETVVFPQSMTPLAIGQERSIKLVDDVVSGDRMLALVTVKNEEAEPPGWDDLYDVGTAAIVHKLIRVPDGTLRILVQGAEADQARAADRRRPVPDRRVRGGAGRDRGDQGARGADAQRPEPVRADHRGRPVPPGGAPDRGRERRRPECALAPRRLDDAPEDRREAGAARPPPTSRSGCTRSRASSAASSR